MAESAIGTTLQIRLLGPVEIVVDGQPRPLVGARQRTLLAFLALHADEGVSGERLIDALWGANPPPTAQASLRVAVSKLRRVLGDAHGTSLETLPGGYRLRIEPGQLDTRRFEELVAEARAETALERTAALLAQALDLWRGPPLADLPHETFVPGESRRLSEARLAARAERIDAQLALGGHQELVSELEVLVAENPLNERLRGQLMLALYRCGRQTEALDVYRRGRLQLLEQLGLEPGDDLRRLEQAILAQDPAIAGTAGSTSPGTDAAERSGGRTRRVPRFARRAALVLGSLLLAGAITGTVISLTSSDTTGVAAVPPYSIAVIDPRTNDLATRITLDGPPTRIAIGPQTLVVANARDQTVARIDVRARRVERRTGIGVTPTAVAVGEGGIWVLSSNQSVLDRIDAYDFVRETKLPLGGAEATSIGDPSGLAVGAGGVWVEDGVKTLFRVDPATGAVKRLVLGKGVDGVAVGGGSVWVTSGSPASVYRINPRTNSVIATISIAARGGVLAPFPIGVAVGAGAVWVLNGNAGTVSRVDPASDAVVATVGRISLNPVRLAAGEGAVWVADALNDAVDRIDPATNKVTQVIPVGGLPVAIAVGHGGVWVAVDSF